MNTSHQIFNITTEQDFNDKTLEIFHYQYKNNTIYRQFCNYLNRSPREIKTIHQIPFLPIEFFKKETIATGTFKPEQIFLSSGTTGKETSKHYVKDTQLYQQSYLKSFEQFYGKIENYCVLAILPSYMERKGSSLIYMADDFIKRSKHSKSGFYLNNTEELINTLNQVKEKDYKILLIGVSFALLDLAEKYTIDLSNVIIMETGGMKGRREEITREALHDRYKKSFNSFKIHSEYGMTELLSQAYSKGNGIFKTPNWMRILIRDINDPLAIVENNKTGGINIIDLANIHSCSFIATQDLGKISSKGFEVLGRFDNSDLRGCNLLIH